MWDDVAVKEKKKNCYTSENGTQISLSLDSFPWRKIDFYLFKERNVVIRLNLIYWKKYIHDLNVEDGLQECLKQNWEDEYELEEDGS